MLLHRLANSPDHPPLTAIHINHQLQAESAQWADHCRAQSAALGVALQVHCVDIPSASGDSLEALARQARYGVFESLLEAGDVLMMGHHLDDQAETVMMRLLRGSGSRGLAGIPAVRPLGKRQLCRPMLGVSREAIEQYANHHGLQWIEDPSNHNTDFDRNFLRQSLLPQLAERWPAYRQTLARAADHQQHSADLNDELAALDMAALHCPIDSRQLPIPALQKLSTLRQKNLLRFWFAQQGVDAPSASQLAILIDEVINAGEDAEPIMRWPELEIRRYNQQLYAMPPLTEFDHRQCIAWNTQQPLQIDEHSRVEVQLTKGVGLAADKLSNTPLQVRFRQGGERCQPAGRAHSQSLKKLFQEYRLPPWLRDRAPIVYAGDDIVAVADLWVCEGWQAKPGQRGIGLSWLRYPAEC